ncbi:MAG: NrfD/PsrC family molybdoenzyme membrane anchor subunit [Thiotrichales bacterium]
MASSKLRFSPLAGNSVGFYGLLGLLGVVVLAGLFAAHHMETAGHYVTGMNNQVVWGMPHVFAVFLIVAASGALNVASIASVFSREIYKPLSRLSAWTAIALLAGGLIVLVLDLGRPDRLIVAMTYYNFKSIFAWNIILYNGFFVIVGIYLWMMMERKMNRFTKPAGFAAFIWRLVLTTGTGSIFGFLVARETYDAAVLAPMFVVMSFSFGLAIFNLVLMASYNWSGRALGDRIIDRLRKLQGIFIAAVLYFLAVFFLTSLYATQHHDAVAFTLLGRDGGGVYAAMFWIGQVVIGGLVPLALLYWPATASNRFWLGVSSVLVILGGLALMYSIIIGGQAFPLTLFPGKEVTSAFQDGEVASYIPSVWELMLGLGGMAIALLLVASAAKLLALLPESLADEIVDPHHSAKH